MSTTPSFYCQSCGRQFPWSAQKAGKTIVCSCSKPLRVPRAPEAAAPAVTPLADDPPAAQEALPTADLRSKPVIRYQSQATEEKQDWRAFIKGSELRHLILPVSFMVLAIVVRLGLIIVGEKDPSQTALVQIGVVIGTMALNTLTLFIAVALVAHFTGAELGPLPITLMKLMAAGMLGSVIMGVAAMYEMEGHSAGIVALHVLVLLYWILFSIFFELDLQENLMAVAIAGLLQAGTFCILWQRAAPGP